MVPLDLAQFQYRRCYAFEGASPSVWEQLKMASMIQMVYMVQMVWKVKMA